MPNKKNLFPEFSPVTKEEWIAKVEKDLKGRAFDELNWTLSVDITLAPFYHSQDFQSAEISSLFSGQSNDWAIGEDIQVDDLKSAGKTLLQALENGVNAPCLILKKPLDQKQLAVLFENVSPDYIATHFKTSDSALTTLKSFHDFLTERGIDTNNIKGSIEDKSLSPENAAALMEFASNKLPGFKTICINIPDEGIEHTAEVLASAISIGKAYIEQLSEGGFSVKSINQQIYFSIEVGSSYFLEIAKIRALKILWLNVLEAYELQNAPVPYIEVHLSAKTFDKKDPNTNMIKATTQAMSAVLGGIDRLTVLPSDFLSGKSSPFARRIARNVQHILKMESFLDRVADPAAGSYYVEKLTEKLALSAWSTFQKSVN